MVKDIKVSPVFPVDMGRVVLELDHDKITEYTIDFINSIDKYTTYHDKDINKQWRDGLQELERLEKDIEESCREFAKKTDRTFGEALITMWASVYNDGKGHGAHIHRRALISGTYYPTEHESHSRILFDAPWESLTMHDSIKEERLRHDYKPKKGDMLMWPSWLQHRVQEQVKTDNPRVAISWNLDNKRG